MGIAWVRFCRGRACELHLRHYVRQALAQDLVLLLRSDEEEDEVCDCQGVIWASPGFVFAGGGPVNCIFATMSVRRLRRIWSSSSDRTRKRMKFAIVRGLYGHRLGSFLPGAGL